MSNSPIDSPAGAPPSLPPSISVLDEPLLEFGNGQQVVDPHAGLTLFGPVDAAMPGQPTQIAYGVAGPQEGLAAFAQFSACLAQPIVSVTFGPPQTANKDRLLWPPFPGFRAAFACDWPAAPVFTRSIDRSALLVAARHKDQHQRAYDVVNMYLDALRIAAERDSPPAVAICVVPDEVYANCRPLSRVKGGTGAATTKKQRIARRESADLFDAYAPDQYDYSVDFRRQLKARAMEYNIPIQIVRESTLRLDEPERRERGLTKLSDRAWNLATAIYYKAVRQPWRIAGARPGVCYVGIAFRRAEADGDPRSACCAAQMFLQNGDGVVFQGRYGPWYSPADNSFHLDAGAAEQLLHGVLNAYSEQGGGPLAEIFLHSRSQISVVEMEGYRRAAPADVALVGIRVRPSTDPVRLYRAGAWPVLRGTLWVTGRRGANLWASGFKPAVLTYDGWEVPKPLQLRIEHGDADIRQVALDILALTKLNYNACKIGDAEPVTVRFSDAVGEILIGNPTIPVRKSAFKFYL